MPGGRRGLLAPQNTFLDTVVKKANEQNLSFLISSSQIVEYPIVFVNELFCKQTGFLRTDVMHQSSMLKFMRGDLTDEDSLAKICNCLETETNGEVEILLYKKNRTPMWFYVNLAPIKSGKPANTAVLFLLTFKDITSTKLPIEEPDTKTGLGRFVKLARTVTQSRNSVNIIPTIPPSTKKPSNTLTNPECLPRYMLEAPKTPPRIILHYSALKTTWDWTILVLTFYTAIMVPYKLTFLKDVTRNLDNPNQLVLFLTDTLIDVAFFIDILLNFHTTYVGSMEEVISDPKLIRWNYLKSWFVIDMLSCVPYDMFDLLAFSSKTTSGKSTGVADAFSTLKIIRLSVRVWRVARKRDHYLEYGGAQLVIFMCGFLLAAHWFACGWFLIGNYEINLEYGWLEIMAQDTNREFGNNISVQHDVISAVYISALYYTISSMTSIGFGNISANTNIEKVFTIVMMIVGALLYAAIFGNVTTIVQQLYSSSARYHEMLNNIRAFMKLHQVPEELCERVMDYAVSSWASTKGINSEKILTYCPKDMKADLCVHMNRKILKQHPAFRLASDGCLRSLAINFEMAHSAPGDLIFHTGESIDYLCFIVAGCLEVIQDDVVVALLGVEDVFGDVFWREPTLGQSTANVRALTYCDIHMIRRENLLEVLSFYRNFAISFARNLHLTVNLRNRKKSKRIIDQKKEQEEEKMRKHEPVPDIPADHPVRKLAFKLKKHGAEHKESILDASSSFTANAGNHVNTEQIVDHEGIKKALMNESSNSRSAWTKFFNSSMDSPKEASRWGKLSSNLPSIRDMEKDAPLLSTPLGKQPSRWTEKGVTKSLKAPSFVQLNGPVLPSPKRKPAANSPTANPKLLVHSKVQINSESISTLMEMRKSLSSQLQEVNQSLKEMDSVLKKLCEENPAKEYESEALVQLNSVGELDKMDRPTHHVHSPNSQKNKCQQISATTNLGLNSDESGDLCSQLTDIRVTVEYTDCASKAVDLNRNHIEPTKSPDIEGCKQTVPEHLQTVRKISKTPSEATLNHEDTALTAQTE